MPFKLLWETYSDARKREFSPIHKTGAPAYIRGDHEGHAFFESLKTSHKRLAAKLFAERQAEILQNSLSQKQNAGRANFAYAVVLYFGTEREEDKDPTGRVAKIFDAFGQNWLDEITQGDLDKLAKKLHPNAGPKTLNREVYTPFVAVYNAAVNAEKAPPRMWRRPKGAHDEYETNPPIDAQIRALMQVAATTSGRNPHKAARNRAAILTVTLTGERTTAVSNIRWRDIRLDDGTMFFGKTKNKKQRLVLMPRLLIQSLKELCKFGCDPAETVFGWKTKSGMTIMVRRARKRAGLEKVRTHDIGRHSFGRRLTQKAKLSRPQLKKAGNWKSDKAVERYEHFDLDEIALAVRDVDTSDLTDEKTRNKSRDNKKARR